MPKSTLGNNFSQFWAAYTVNLTLNFLAKYTISHTYGSIHLDDLTHTPKYGLPHTTKLRSDFAGTFATAVFPRWTEA
jgi:hypothetical protein